VVENKNKQKTSNGHFGRRRRSPTGDGDIGGIALARRVFLTTLLSMTTLGHPSAAQQTPPSDALTPSDAMRLFAREKSAAEQYAVILSTIGKNDAVQYIRGIKLYADAKAEFDGLIEELRFDLLNGREPASSATFNEALKKAAEERVAFTSFVSSKVDELGGARPLLPDVIQSVPELVKAITDAGLAIWKEFRSGREQHRDALLNELDHLKWQPFAQLAKP